MKNRFIYLLIGVLIFKTCYMTFHPVPREINGWAINESKNPVNINNFSLSNVPKLQQNHILTPPYIISPTEGETCAGTVCINWTKAIDSYGHTVRYTVSISQDRLRWRDLKSGIRKTYYDWDTRETNSGDYSIKVEAKCSAGFTRVNTVDRVTVQNIPPEVRFLLIILLFAIISFILIGTILYRKRGRSSATGGFTSLNDLKTVKIGLCLGSFTDNGLIIKGKNDNCPFSLTQMQSMLEYSAALYQHGKAETMYGPIPIASLKEIEQRMEPSQTEWSFVSYWSNVKDSTVEDSRIIKIGGVVPAVLLVFYPKQLDHIVMVKKNNIYDIFKSVINKIVDISDFTNEILNQIEQQLLKLFIS